VLCNFLSGVILRLDLVRGSSRDQGFRTESPGDPVSYLSFFKKNPSDIILQWDPHSPEHQLLGN
jgi:hypothetical protein